MSTFTALNKSSATWTGRNKSSTSWSGTDKTNFGIQYIVTDTPDYVMVGSAEDEYLIFSEGISWTGTNKS